MDFKFENIPGIEFLRKSFIKATTLCRERILMNFFHLYFNSVILSILLSKWSVANLLVTCTFVNTARRKDNFPHFPMVTL